MADHMTQSLEDFASALIADGVIDTHEVKKIRERLFADNVIDRTEANFLFTVNDAVSAGNNDPGWQNLFVEALTNHVLNDEKSPGVLDEEEAKYLMGKIQGDKKVDATELALLVNISASAKSTPESFQAFTLSSMKTAILEDGVIEESEVQMIRKVIYGAGSGAGASVDRTEANFLFDLHDATRGKQNHPSWKNLFVEAVSKHLLQDEVSPGEIDEAESSWLLSRIKGEGKDDNEKALLTNVKKNAKSISSNLKSKLDALGI